MLSSASCAASGSRAVSASSRSVTDALIAASGDRRWWETTRSATVAPDPPAGTPPRGEPEQEQHLVQDPRVALGARHRGDQFGAQRLQGLELLLTSLRSASSITGPGEEGRDQDRQAQEHEQHDHVLAPADQERVVGRKEE